MKKNSMPFLLLLGFCFWWAPANAETNKLDNIAACAGVVIGNGAIDFFMGDEAAFNEAAEIAYSAYLSEVSQVKQHKTTYKLLTKYLQVIWIKLLQPITAKLLILKCMKR